MINLKEISSNKETWTTDIKNIIMILPKIENKIIKQLEDINFSKNKILKIDIEDKNNKFEITIKKVE